VQVDDAVRCYRVGDDGFEIEGRSLAADRGPRAGEVDTQAARRRGVAGEPDETARQQMPARRRGACRDAEERRVDDEQPIGGSEVADGGAEPAENCREQNDADDAETQ